MKSVCPVTYREASVTKYSTPFAMSEGTPRPSGISYSARWL